MGHSHRTTQAMSEEQLKAFLEAVKSDAGLQEKLKGARDLDAALAMAMEAGFDASQMLKADWELLKAQQPIELSDDELEQVSGGTFTACGCGGGTANKNNEYVDQNGKKI